jgi:hypothetical protein
VTDFNQYDEFKYLKTNKNTHITEKLYVKFKVWGLICLNQQMLLASV